MHNGFFLFLILKKFIIHKAFEVKILDLFDECLEALGKNKEILSEELTANYYELLSNSFPFTSWGRIK
ncbi:DNase/tRNase domain of colicin-like bacteriocin [Bacillus sp. FW1]|nr:DNase/tRNase domain of colicin-like bacteriocin [Bacillus sp. FW1]